MHAYLVPLLPTSEFPSPLFSKTPSFLNSLSHKLALTMMTRGFWGADNVGRKEILQMRGNSVLDLVRVFPKDEDSVLNGLSSAVVEKPKDWGAKHPCHWLLDLGGG